MNNSRPIIKIFLFPYTERTERIFSSDFANFFLFRPHTKMLDTPKLLLGSEKKKRKKKKNFQKDWENK